jgi:N utilization substance protein B
MQTLFEWDFKGNPNEEALPILRRNIVEFGPGLDQSDFLETLVAGIVKKQKIIDEIIEKAAPDWPLAKIAVVDRNVLRLGLYELLFGDRDQVPPKVAINEAIELAKSFGGENSGRFVNGVLGAVYREIGEPGKDQTSKKDQIEPEDFDSLPIDQKAGVVVYAIDENEDIHLAMVHDVFGYWTLSKSTVHDNETPEEAAARAIREEISLETVIETQLGANEYLANHPQRGKVRKQVKYFLGKSDFVPLKLIKESGGLDDAKWFTLEEIPGLTMYNDITEMITKAIEIIVGVVGQED